MFSSATQTSIITSRTSDEILLLVFKYVRSWNFWLVHCRFLLQLKIDPKLFMKSWYFIIFLLGESSKMRHCWQPILWVDWSLVVFNKNYRITTQFLAFNPQSAPSHQLVHCFECIWLIDASSSGIVILMTTRNISHANAISLSIRWHDFGWIIYLFMNLFFLYFLSALCKRVWSSRSAEIPLFQKYFVNIYSLREWLWHSCGLIQQFGATNVWQQFGQVHVHSAP